MKNAEDWDGCRNAASVAKENEEAQEALKNNMAKKRRRQATRQFKILGLGRRKLLTPLVATKREPLKIKTF